MIILETSSSKEYNYISGEEGILCVGVPCDDGIRDCIEEMHITSFADTLNPHLPPDFMQS